MNDTVDFAIPFEVIEDAIQEYLVESGVLSEDEVFIPDLGLPVEALDEDEPFCYIVEGEIISLDDVTVYDDLEYDPIGGSVEEIDEEIEVDELTR